MSNAFIQVAHRGHNHWWRYLLGSLVALFGLFVVGGLVSFGFLAAYVASDGNPNTTLLPIETIEATGSVVSGVGPSAQYFFANLSFVVFLFSIYWVLKVFHGRSLRSLITPAARISWLRIAQGFGVFFMLKLLEIFISYLSAPEDFTLNFQPKAFLIFLPIVLIMAPLQTTAEELFFRGYLIQGIGSKLGQAIAVLLSSSLFAMLHSANPEVQTQTSWEGSASLMIYFFLVAAFLSFITLKDRTAELAIGVHAANNIATFLLVTSPNSVLPSPALFSITKIEASFANLFFTAVFLLAFAFIVFRLLKRPLPQV